MDFIRNIILVGPDKNEIDLIKAQLEQSSHKLKVHGFFSRKQVFEAFSQIEMNCIYLNSNLDITDLSYIIKYLSLLKNEKKLNAAIFLSDDQFNHVQNLLNQFPENDIVVINKPLDMNDLIRKIHFKTFGKFIENNSQISIKSDLNVDLEFINVFITQTKEVLKEMSQATDLKHSAPILMSKYKEKNKEDLPIAISSRIRISSEFFRGSYYIAFTKETFLNFYEAMVGEKTNEINQQNKDLAGEIANIVYGKCKKKFSSEGLNLEMVIPSVHLGKIDNSVVVIIPFSSSLGEFYIAVAPGQI